MNLQDRRGSGGRCRGSRESSRGSNGIEDIMRRLCGIGERRGSLWKYDREEKEGVRGTGSPLGGYSMCAR